MPNTLYIDVIVFVLGSFILIGLMVYQIYMKDFSLFVPWSMAVGLMIGIAEAYFRKLADK